MFEKYGPNEKKYRQQNRCIFNFTIISEKLIQIGSLVTEIQNCGEDVGLILCNINLSRKV